MIAIRLKNISKTYKKNDINILNNINYSFELGKLYVINGHSGSGKSTFINILGLLVNYDSGSYYLFDQDVKKFNSKERAKAHAQEIGLIFQNYLLDDYLKAYEQIIMPMLINKDIKVSNRKEYAISLLNKVGLENRMNHYPKELSGGEQQRIAIARSLVNNPRIILADEPTGNLDINNEEVIFKELKKLSENGKCVIVVTHSLDAAKYADVILKLENGSLEEVNND